MQLFKSCRDFYVLDLGGLDFVHRFPFGVLGKKMELAATCRLHQQERIQFKNGEEGEVAGGRLIVPHDISHVEAGGKTMGKTGVSVAELRHLGLEFPVGHTCSIAVDNAEVGWRNFFCWGIAVGQRRIEHEASTGGVPLLACSSSLRPSPWCNLAACNGFYFGAPLPWKCKKCQLG